VAINAAQDLATAREEAQLEALRLAQLHANLLDAHIQGVDALLRALTTAISIDELHSEANAALLRTTLAGLPPAYTDIFIGPSDGTTVPTGRAGRSEGSAAWAGRSDIREALAAQELIVRVSAARRTGEVVLARPIAGRDGAPIGLLNVATRLDRLPRLDTRDLPSGSVITVLDERGVVLARSTEYDAWVGRDLGQLGVVQAALARRHGTGEVVGADGVARLSAYTTATRAPWLVEVGMPTELVLGAGRVALLRNLWLGALALVTAVVLAWGVAGRIAAPLRQLAADGAALGAGKLARRTTVRGGDEVGVLAAVFNQMAESIERHVADLRASQAGEQQARLKAEEAGHQLRDLQTITDTALAHRGLDDLLRELLIRLRAILAADTATILLLSDGGEHLVIRAALGFEESSASEARIPVGSGVEGRIAASRQPLVVDDLAEQDVVSPILRERGVRSLVGAPLLVDDRAIGVVLVGALTHRSFSAAETDLLLRAAERMALAIEHAHLYDEIHQREAQLRDLVRRLQVAQEEERRRVAYEVHDGLAQIAASAHQHLQTFADIHPPDSPTARVALDQTVEMVQRTVREARRVIAGLRPTALDDFGLGTAIHFEVETLRSEGWPAVYEAELGEERLSPMIETALFRVAQEALTNVRKHAGRCRVVVSLRRDDGQVRLTVRDWGRGFAVRGSQDGAGPGERIGLLGMRERVMLLAGTFAVESLPGAGTTVVAEVPLAAPAPTAVTVGGTDGA
jgi:signal transduction histidine kinase